MAMTYHRYTHILVPLGRCLRRLAGRRKAWFGLLEASLLMSLIVTLHFYTGMQPG